jgi:aspartyl/asparaginyl-tRNA synthetase
MPEAVPPGQPTKNALKKQAKELDKARKRAEKAAQLQQQKELQIRQREADDFAADNYGERPDTNAVKSADGWVQFSNIDKFEDKECHFRCVAEQSRIQSAKLGFIHLTQGLDSVQLVVAETPELVSRSMVKFAAAIPPESVCTIVGVVKRPAEKIKSTSVQDFEIQARKIYIVAKAQAPLPLQPADSEGPLPLEDEKDSTASPLVSLNTRLNNRVLDLRAKLNHCIFVLKDGVDALFQEFLRGHGFIRIHTPKTMGAASESMWLARVI